MEDNIYLDKVVEYLVRDTKIDHDKEEIQYPFFPSNRPFLLFSRFLPIFSSFSKYCRDVYGLTDKEIEYVWKEYKEKIENGE